jgi:hypothetical protein
MRSTGNESDTVTSGLQARVDYIYCDECEKHVPCVRLEPGVWEVQCPECVGECALCSCHLVGYCIGKGSTPAKTHMFLVKPRTIKPPPGKRS